MTNEDKFWEWWNGDEMADDLDVVKHTPLYWAMQGWEAALREMNKEAEKNGEPLWDAVDVKKNYTNANAYGLFL